jgi:hypothetical protein
VPALCSSKVLALYSSSGLIRVFTDARGAYNYIVVRCQLLYFSGGFVKVFTDARGAVSL